MSRCERNRRSDAGLKDNVLPANARNQTRTRLNGSAFRGITGILQLSVLTLVRLSIVARDRGYHPVDVGFRAACCLEISTRNAARAAVSKNTGMSTNAVLRERFRQVAVRIFVQKNAPK